MSAAGRARASAAAQGLPEHVEDAGTLARAAAILAAAPVEVPEQRSGPGPKPGAAGKPLGHHNAADGILSGGCVTAREGGA